MNPQQSNGPGPFLFAMVVVCIVLTVYAVNDLSDRIVVLEQKAGISHSSK